ncbi:MAG: hypothetical protein JNL42_16890 [Anaerolineae bacterium]|nr:hypothetical protein [Anaerolineae bacterium]
MRKIWTRVRFVLLLSGLVVAPAFARLQNTSECPRIVEEALSTVDSFCAATGRNQACFGHIALTADLRGEPGAISFEQPGDVVDVASLESMHLSPLLASTGEWGVSLMRLQANLPDTLPGENVTFLLFGDVEVQNAVPEEEEADASLKPMQAFRLRTGISDAPCEGAPQSGMVVQTPEGVGSVIFNINGVDVEMGSTVFFQASVSGGMTVSTLEGAAHVATDLGAQPVLAGTWVRIALDDDLQASRAPGWPRPYTCRSAIHAALPLSLLPRDIDITPAMENEQFDVVQGNIEASRPLCGEPGLPDCENYPFLQGDHQCLLTQGSVCGG